MWQQDRQTLADKGPSLWDQYKYSISTAESMKWNTLNTLLVLAANWHETQCYKVNTDGDGVLAHWPLGDVIVILKQSFSNSYP